MANAESTLDNGGCGIGRDESMRRMMSFVEPLGHSQIVDRQSLASLPVGFVKLSITDDSKMLRVRMVDFMKSLSASRKSPANSSAGSGKSQSNPAIAQVSIKGYLAANNLVFESKATTDQQNSSGGSSSSSRASSLLFDKREILSSLDKRNQDNVSFFHSEQVLQVCIFTYPAPYRMKTFLGTVHIAIADMRCSCNGHVNLSSFYKIFPTSSFVAGCPVIGVAPHCVNRCHIKNGSPLDKLCEDAKTTKKTTTTTAAAAAASSAGAATTSNCGGGGGGGGSKLRLSQLAHASSTITPRNTTSSSSAPCTTNNNNGGHITKSHSLRAIVSALTHRRRVITNNKLPTTSTNAAGGGGRNKIESDVSLDNGYGSSSGDNCSRSSNVKLNDMHHHHSFSASSPRGARLCYRRSEPSFAASIPASPRSSRLIAQTSIDSVRSFAGSSSNATDSSEDALSSGPCVCGAECCPPGMYDGLNYFSVSTGAIGCSSTAPRTRRKTIPVNATSKGKAIQGIVSSMKTLVYSVRLRTRLANRGKDGKASGKSNALSSRPTTAVPSSLRSFSLGPLTDKGEYDDEKDNVFEVLASLKKIRFEETKKPSGSSGESSVPTTTTSSETTETSTKTSPPGSFDEGKTSSDDGISFAVIDPHDPIVTLATSTWSCEECILASLAEKSMLTSTNLHRSSPRHRSTRHSSRRLVRQKCFRSSDDVSMNNASGSLRRLACMNSLDHDLSSLFSTPSTSSITTGTTAATSTQGDKS